MTDGARARSSTCSNSWSQVPFAAGKTTLIQSVSQTPVVDTDVVTTGDESAVKSRTTVAMDFGTYVVDGGDVRLLMFGTPGQPRFWFMTDILKGQVDAVIYVVDAEATDTHVEAGAAMRRCCAICACHSSSPSIAATSRRRRPWSRPPARRPGQRVRAAPAS